MPVADQPGLDPVHLALAVRKRLLAPHTIPVALRETVMRIAAQMTDAQEMQLSHRTQRRASDSHVPIRTRSAHS